jgi:hypothetical protein
MTGKNSSDLGSFPGVAEKYPATTVDPFASSRVKRPPSSLSAERASQFSFPEIVQYWTGLLAWMRVVIMAIDRSEINVRMAN